MTRSKHAAPNSELFSVLNSCVGVSVVAFVVALVLYCFIFGSIFFTLSMFAMMGILMLVVTQEIARASDALSTAVAGAADLALVAFVICAVEMHSLMNWRGSVGIFLVRRIEIAQSVPADWIRKPLLQALRLPNSSTDEIPRNS